MRIPVLMYHAVLPIEPDARVRGTVPLARFREQVGWLAERGFTSLDLEQWLRDPGAIDPHGKPVVFTFDDGYRCVIEHALPVLEAAGFTATLFIVTGSVGGESRWYAHKGGPAFEHASWSELESAHARGFALGAHGVSHRRLTELPPDEVDHELGASREELEKHVGRCTQLAYPYGAVSPFVVERTRIAGFVGACTTTPGWNNPQTDPLELARQSISRDTTLARFRRRVRPWWAWT